MMGPKRDYLHRVLSGLCLLGLCTSVSAQAGPGDHVRAGGAELTAQPGAVAELAGEMLVFLLLAQ